MKCDIQPFQNGDWGFIKEKQQANSECCHAAVMRLPIRTFHTATIYTVKSSPRATQKSSLDQDSNILIELNDEWTIMRKP